MDRFVPTSCSILPKPRQRPRPDSETYGGQVGDTLQQWCAMYFAQTSARPPFAPELPSKIAISAPSLVVLCRPASPVLAHCRYGRPLFLLLILLGLFFASLFARMSGPSSA